MSAKAKKYAIGNIKNMKRYIEMLHGTDLGLEIKTEEIEDNKFIVSGNLDTFSMMAISWCNYANCLGDSQYIMRCKEIDRNKVIIQILENNSIERSICHSENGVVMFKVFKNTKNEEGKYKKKTLGYGVEKAVVNAERATFQMVKCCYGDKSLALQIYKEQIKCNKQLVDAYGKDEVWAFVKRNMQNEKLEVR